ncbi:MAG: SDR family oxidoreductase [Clostridiales bacterium]|nr:SDR family oxidoreductase [Clostridiales bacterium]
MEYPEFQGKTAVITGGASGMGLLSGKNYAKNGANVVLVDINREALDECVKEIEAYPANVLGVCIDIRDYDKVCEARDKAVERFGTIDILINAAGGAECRICKAPAGPFFDMPIDIYDFGIDVNLKGALYFDHACMKVMAAQKSGVIVHFGSITGEEGCGKNIAYSASKCALMYGMNKSIAQAGAPYNIRSVAIAPGPVLTRPAMANMKTMVGRAAEVQEIVDMILYVTSKKGAFINGTHILMDGGRAAWQHSGN